METVTTTDEPLMTLKEGAAMLGLKSPASLRTEIANGRLQPIIIAGRHYVTRSILREMIEACRAKPKAQGSGSNAILQESDGGSSSTVDPSVAQDAVKMTLQALKERSKPTSRRSTYPAGSRHLLPNS